MSADRRSSRPRAELLTIAELLDQVELGKIRVTPLRRAWMWHAKDIRDLFDSLWRGIPIGTLIMWRRAADAEVLTLGPVKINCNKRTDAWFVMDGYQRLTALVGVLLSDQDDPQLQEFNLYFDLKNETWNQSSGSSTINPAWFPLRDLFNVSNMLRWIRSNAASEELGPRVSELRQAIIETRVPIYVVESEDPTILRDVFVRINHSGKKLSLSHSMNLLFGTDGLEAPSRLSDLREEIAQLGFGDVAEAEIGRCVLFANGRQLARSPRAYLAQLVSTERAQLLKDAREPLRQAVIFLQSQAGINHKLLLPQALPLYVLTRFFAVYPNPSPRCRVLLARWVWKRLTTEYNGYNGWESTLRIFQAAMSRTNTSRSDEQIAETLLGRITQSDAGMLLTRRTFDLSRPTTRIQALAMLTANPRSLVSGDLLDVSALLSKHGNHTFQRILSKPPPGMAEDLFSSIANRVFHPPLKGGSVRALLRSRSASPEQLASHDLPASLLDDPSDAAIVAALQARAVTLQRRVRDLVDLRCAWERPNRVSVSAILDEEDTEPEARTP